MSKTDNPISDQSEKMPNPPELKGASLSKSSLLPTVIKDEKESVTTDIEAFSENRFPFGSFVHNYVWASIQFAEQKAAFVFAVDSAFLGYLVTTIPSNLLQIAPLQQVLIASALMLLGSSIAAVLTVIMPRLGGDFKGIVYFGAISKRATAAEYSTEVLRANRSELDSATAQHIYEIAVICTRKYKRIRWAIWLGLFGSLAGLLWLATLRIPANTPYVDYPTLSGWNPSLTVLSQEWNRHFGPIHYGDAQFLQQAPPNSVASSFACTPRD